MEMGSGSLEVIGSTVALALGIPFLIVIIVVTFKEYRRAQANMARAAEASSRARLAAEEAAAARDRQGES